MKALAKRQTCKNRILFLLFSPNALTFSQKVVPLRPIYAGEAQTSDHKEVFRLPVQP